MRRLLLTLTAALATMATAYAQPRWPAQAVRDLNGRIRQFAEYAPERGVTLLVFWKTCCPNNITMIDELQDVWSEYDARELPIDVLLVSVDDQRSASRVKPVVATNGWEWPVILDLNGELARLYNVTMPPQWIAIDRSGKVLYRSKISNGFLDSALYFEELTNEIHKNQKQIVP